jgi:hypothetical protein
MSDQRGQQVGLCLMKSDEADAVVEYFKETSPDVRIEDHVTFYRAEAQSKIVVDLADVGERLGRPLTLPEFLVIMSTYYGRVEVEDMKFIVTAALPQLEDR